MGPPGPPGPGMPVGGGPLGGWPPRGPATKPGRGPIPGPGGPPMFMGGLFLSWELSLLFPRSFPRPRIKISYQHKQKVELSIGRHIYINTILLRGVFARGLLKLVQVELGDMCDHRILSMQFSLRQFVQHYPGGGLGCHVYDAKSTTTYVMISNIHTIIYTVVYAGRLCLPL